VRLQRIDRLQALAGEMRGNLGHALDLDALQRIAARERPAQIGVGQLQRGLAQRPRVLRAKEVVDDDEGGVHGAQASEPVRRPQGKKEPRLAAGFLSCGWNRTRDLEVHAAHAAHATAGRHRRLVLLRR